MKNIIDWADKARFNKEIILYLKTSLTKAGLIFLFQKRILLSEKT